MPEEEPHQAAAVRGKALKPPHGEVPQEARRQLDVGVGRRRVPKLGGDQGKVVRDLGQVLAIAGLLQEPRRLLEPATSALEVIRFVRGHTKVLQDRRTVAEGPEPAGEDERSTKLDLGLGKPEPPELQVPEAGSQHHLHVSQELRPAVETNNVRQAPPAGFLRGGQVAPEDLGR